MDLRPPGEPPGPVPDRTVPDHPGAPGRRVTLEQVHRISERLSPDDPTRAMFETIDGARVPAPVVAISIAMGQRPVATFVLLVMNVLLFGVTFLLEHVGDITHRLAFLVPEGALSAIREPGHLLTLLALGANFPPAIDAGQYFRFLSACFLHNGILHLIVNMIGLVNLGRFCEALFGRLRFLILYFVAGLAGSVLSYAMSRGGFSVGASGALFGLLGATAVFPLRAGRILPRDMKKRLVRQILPWVLFNLYITFAVPVIDVGGHLGGLVAGSLLALVLGSPAIDPWHLRRGAIRTFGGAVGLLVVFLTFNWVGWLIGIFSASSR